MEYLSDGISESLIDNLLESPGVKVIAHIRLSNTKARAFYFARRYDQVLEALKNTLELDQNYPDAHITFGCTLYGQGDVVGSYCLPPGAIRLEDNSVDTQVHLGVPHAKGRVCDREYAN